VNSHQGDIYIRKKENLRKEVGGGSQIDHSIVKALRKVAQTIIYRKKMVGLEESRSEQGKVSKGGKEG